MPDPGKSGPALAGLVVLGSELVGFAVAGVALDYACGTLNSTPWFTITLTPLGLVVVMVQAVRTLDRANNGPTP